MTDGTRTGSKFCIRAPQLLGTQNMFWVITSPKTFCGLFRKFFGLNSGGRCQYISYPSEAMWRIKSIDRSARSFST